MPPFRIGLLKRKIDSHTTAKSNGVPDDNEEAGSDLDNIYLPDILELKGNDTESENEQFTAASSDTEDKVSFGADKDSPSAADKQIEELSEQSSELTDSESGDESDSPESVSAPARRPRRRPRRAAAAAAADDSLAAAVQRASVSSTRPVAQHEEYESGDTSDEEERRNTAGDVPAHWYREYAHVGYDVAGRRLLRPPRPDHIDQFLRRCEEPDFWRTVRDPATGQDVVLAPADLRLLRRLRASMQPSDTDLHQPWVEWFSGAVLATPVRAFPEHKRSFLPSRDERRRVARLVHALRCGWAKTRAQLARERRDRQEKRFYDLWGAGEAATRGGARHIPAPRRPPPAHAESYNPPPEYLLDAGELAQWRALEATPWKRKHSFLPRAHRSLREVPAYPRFVRERFLRCLDLYLAPRALKMRLTLAARDLVPALPAPRDLRPFPAAEALRLRGHRGAVRALAFSPAGHHVATGGDDGDVRVWETATGRCVRVLAAGAPVCAVAWVPAGGLSAVAAAAGARLLLLAPGEAAGARGAAAATAAALAAPPPAAAADARTAAAVSWDAVAADEWARGVRLALTHFRPLTGVSWHARGDYACVTLREAGARSVLVHQVSRRRSQCVFARAPGLVQCAVFHPTRPQLLVGTQRSVRVYDLARGALARTLRPGVQWVSSLAVHPGGEHLAVGSFDRRVVWFELELAARPWAALRLHARAVRSLAFHPRYPLLASGGDDAHVLVTHAAVAADLVTPPLLVPLKRLAAGARRDTLCVLALAWHPLQPWLAVAGADGDLRLYC